jgi:hypothetical protein
MSFSTHFGGTTLDRPALLSIMDSNKVLFSLPLIFESSSFNLQAYIEQFIFPKLIAEFGRGKNGKVTHQFGQAVKLKLTLIRKTGQNVPTDAPVTCKAGNYGAKILFPAKDGNGFQNEHRIIIRLKAEITTNDVQSRNTIWTPLFKYKYEVKNILLMGNSKRQQWEVESIVCTGQNKIKIVDHNNARLAKVELTRDDGVPAEGKLDANPPKTVSVAVTHQNVSGNVQNVPHDAPVTCKAGDYGAEILFPKRYGTGFQNEHRIIIRLVTEIITNDNETQIPSSSWTPLYKYYFDVKNILSKGNFKRQQWEVNSIQCIGQNKIKIVDQNNVRLEKLELSLSRVSAGKGEVSD